jgi:hypothetical protein
VAPGEDDGHPEQAGELEQPCDRVTRVPAGDEMAEDAVEQSRAGDDRQERVHDPARPAGELEPEAGGEHPDGDEQRHRRPRRPQQAGATAQVTGRAVTVSRPCCTPRSLRHRAYRLLSTTTGRPGAGHCLLSSERERPVEPDVEDDTLVDDVDDTAADLPAIEQAAGVAGLVRSTDARGELLG